MEEKEIIAKLRGLRELKPSEEWVNLTKSEILGAEQPREKLFSGDFLLLNNVYFCPFLFEFFAF